MTDIQKLTTNKDVIAYLAEKFPRCFSLEGEAKPLKVGLFQDLVTALADDERVSKTQLRQALRAYTSNWRYLHGCKPGAVRVDLNGEPCGELEQEHIEHAQKQLAEAKARVAEKRAVEQKAARAARAEQAKDGQERSKRPARGKPQRKSAVKNKAVLTPVNMETLQQGAKVRVKVGDRAKTAIVLDAGKDSARVQLDNGLIIAVSADRLFA